MSEPDTCSITMRHIYSSVCELANRLTLFDASSWNWQLLAKSDAVSRARKMTNTKQTMRAPVDVLVPVAAAAAAATVVEEEGIFVFLFDFGHFSVIM